MTKQNKIENIMGLKWDPWVGDNYFQQKTKTLILGESHYLWDDEENALDILNEQNFTQAIIYNNLLKFMDDIPDNIRNLKNLERAVFNKSQIDLEISRNYWSKTCYYVIIQRYLESIDHRPTKEDFTNGWIIFSEILKILKPDIILSTGVEASNYLEVGNKIGDYTVKKIIRKDKIGNTYPRVAELSTHEHKVKIFFLKHSSKYFPWKDWGNFLRKEKAIYNR